MRRLALEGGSTGLATTLTLSVYMGALGIASWLVPRFATRGLRTYGWLEVAVAGWAVAAPTFLHSLAPLLHGSPTLRVTILAVVLLAVPGFMHGATLPVLARCCRSPSEVAGLYAWNTAGAVAGTLTWTFIILPVSSVRMAEWTSALLAFIVGGMALSEGRSQPAGAGAEAASTVRPWRAAVLAGASGAAALAVEVCGARVTALLVGGSVYAFSLVLATFLTGIAAGSAFARRVERPPEQFLGVMAVSVVLFVSSWRVLPHAIAGIWQLGGEHLWLPGATLLLVCTLGPVALASGATFTACLQTARAEAGHATGTVLALNTAGSVLGASIAGLLGLPLLGVWGTALAAAGLLALAAASRPGWGSARVLAGLTIALMPVVPRWDPALYAVGLGLRVSEFADLSPGAVERFAHEGWELLDYTDGVTTTVAVGRSTRTGNTWLSLNGKVDASTGRDMATQELSGVLPVQIARQFHPEPEAVVVGLASGVTAARALEAGAATVTVLEIEPAVVKAARHFSAVNGDLLDNPLVEIQVADARTWLSAPGKAVPVLISEPSNPWLTGVSNLFTQQYWQLTRARLSEDGVFCQWIQLYALPPEAFRALVRTFLTVYPKAWLFESIPGADTLLIAAPSLPPDLPIQPTLGPEGLARLARMGPLVTDNQPRVEFAAPMWLHRATGTINQQQIDAAAR